MNDKTRPSKKERAISLLGLAASKPPAAEMCPSDEEMAAFIDNRIRGHRRQSMLAHLNRCATCYHRWLEVASYLSTSGAETYDENQVSEAMQKTTEEAASYFTPEEQTSKMQATRPRLSQSKVQFWLTYLGRWQVAIPAALAVAVVGFLMLWPPPSDIDAQISESYVRVIQADGANLLTIARDLPVPWGKAALGFSAPEITMPAQAFGAGVWFGQKTLLQTESKPFPEGLSPPHGVTWKVSKWQDYYSFGRWAVFLWALAQSEQAEAEWNAYPQLLQELRTNLSKHPVDERAARDTIAALDRIEPLLATVNRQRDSQSFAALSRTLLMIMEHLAPSSL